MAVAFDGETILAAHSASASSHTASSKTTAGTNRVGVVRIRITTPEFDNGGTSVTWNGVSMTQVGSGVKVTAGGAGGVRAYRIVNPPTGASDIVITPAAGNSAVGYIVTSYNGVDQTTPTGTPATNSGSSTTPTVDVSAATGDMVLDMVAASAPFSGTGAGQTVEGTPTDGSNYVARGSREDGAATVTMSHTISSANWASIGFALKAVAAGDPAPTLTSINGGTSITLDATGQPVVGADFDTVTFELEQDDGPIALDSSNEDADSADIDVVSTVTPSPKFGAATLRAINADDQQDELAVTVDPPTGTDWVEIVSLNTGDIHLEFTPALDTGDQVWWRVNDVAFDETDFTVNDDGTFQITVGLDPADVEVNRRIASTGAWEGWAVISIDDGEPDLVEVPNVVGQDEATATSTLEGEGFVVSVIEQYSASVAVGDVISQTPTGGSSAAEGSTVTIYVSLGPSEDDFIYRPFSFNWWTQ